MGSKLDSQVLLLFIFFLKFSKKQIKNQGGQRRTAQLLQQRRQPLVRQRGDVIQLQGVRDERSRGNIRESDVIHGLDTKGGAHRCQRPLLIKKIKIKRFSFLF